MADKKEEVTDQVVLRAKRRFDDGVKHYQAGERIVMSTGGFILEIEKGKQKRESVHPGTGVVNEASHKPTSAFLNHCVFVKGNDEAKKAYEKFMKGGK